MASDEAFSYLTLSLATYTVNWDHYFNQVVRAVLKLAVGDSSKRNETLIIPHFRRGASIGPPASVDSL